MATEEDWDSYVRAVIDIAPPDRDRFRLVPAEVGAVDRWPDGLVAPVVVVTAWNPDSVHLPPGDNRARTLALVTELDRLGVTHWPAVGRDLATTHHEEGVVVSGLTEAEGVEIGLHHGQAAVYVWTPAAWSVVSCTDERRHMSGWRLVDPPPSSG
ncbi:MAG TPA: DUF3293 domain-containing protein [Acidimicrobiales bacterium]